MPLALTSRAIKDMKAMPAADWEGMLSKLETFAKTGAGDVKKLIGSPFYRLRHGDWRAIFDKKGDVIVLRVLNRREAYR